MTSGSAPPQTPVLAPSRALSFPLVLGLFRRPDDQPGRPRCRHPALDPQTKRAGLAVSSIGGRFALEDDGETPDTQDTLFRFPHSTATWSHREAAHGPVPPRGAYYYGTKGAMTITREGFDITGDLNRPPENAIPTFRGHPQGGPRAAQRPPEPWIPPQTMPGSVQEQFDLHTRNFLDCIKSRQRPIADVEDGHFTSTACHLANISLRLGRTLHWNPETEQIAGDPEAAAMLERPYRAPWDRVLKSLLA
jgi:hypothetical protein